MRTNIENHLVITCSGVDLTKISHIEFYVRQREFFESYTPAVVSPTEMLVVIPLEDARRLRPLDAKIQFAFVDENGTPRATDEQNIEVKKLLKEAGYDPF